MAMTGNGKGSQTADPKSKGNEGLVDSDRGTVPVPSGSPKAARQTGKVAGGMSSVKNGNDPSSLVRRAPEGSRTV